MPVKTALNLLEKALAETLHSYWRVKAANAAMSVFSGTEYWTRLEVEFANVPSSSEVPAPQQVSFEVLRAEIGDYFNNGRASQDYFLAVIAHFERFISTVLQANQKDSSGTLGQLTTRAEQYRGLTILDKDVAFVAEIRERRNSLIHNHGTVSPRYLQAANNPTVASIFGGKSIGDILNISDEYLANAVDSLIRYARLF
ncbi:hypothetical protein [Pseudomonas sp. S1(2024)]|uniref:hypothetical protein n=1 Tax=Pseudomonas sp. S1(2024) TaxID=3390191 RepID=UPI0039783B5F